MVSYNPLRQLKEEKEDYNRESVPEILPPDFQLECIDTDLFFHLLSFMKCNLFPSPVLILQPDTKVFYFFCVFMLLDSTCKTALIEVDTTEVSSAFSSTDFKSGMDSQGIYQNIIRAG